MCTLLFVVVALAMVLGFLVTLTRSNAPDAPATDIGGTPATVADPALPAVAVQTDCSGEPRVSGVEVRFLDSSTSSMGTTGQDCPDQSDSCPMGGNNAQNPGGKMRDMLLALRSLVAWAATAARVVPTAAPTPTPAIEVFWREPGKPNRATRRAATRTGRTGRTRALRGWRVAVKPRPASTLPRAPRIPTGGFSGNAANRRKADRRAKGLTRNPDFQAPKRSWKYVTQGERAPAPRQPRVRLGQCPRPKVRNTRRRGARFALPRGEWAARVRAEQEAAYVASQAITFGPPTPKAEAVKAPKAPKALKAEKAPKAPKDLAAALAAAEAGLVAAQGTGWEHLGLAALAALAAQGISSVRYGQRVNRWLERKAERRAAKAAPSTKPAVPAAKPEVKPAPEVTDTQALLAANQAAKQAEVLAGLGRSLVTMKPTAAPAKPKAKPAAPAATAKPAAPASKPVAKKVAKPAAKPAVKPVASSSKPAPALKKAEKAPTSVASESDTPAIILPRKGRIVARAKAAQADPRRPWAKAKAPVVSIKSLGTLAEVWPNQSLAVMPLIGVAASFEIGLPLWAQAISVLGVVLGMAARKGKATPAPVTPTPTEEEATTEEAPVTPEATSTAPAASAEKPKKARAKKTKVEAPAPTEAPVVTTTPEAPATPEVVIDTLPEPPIGGSEAASPEASTTQEGEMTTPTITTTTPETPAAPETPAEKPKKVRDTSLPPIPEGGKGFLIRGPSRKRREQLVARRDLLRSSTDRFENALQAVLKDKSGWGTTQKVDLDLLRAAAREVRTPQNFWRLLRATKGGGAQVWSASGAQDAGFKPGLETLAWICWEENCPVGFSCSVQIPKSLGALYESSYGHFGDLVVTHSTEQAESLELGSKYRRLMVVKDPSVDEAEATGDEPDVTVWIRKRIVDNFTGWSGASLGNGKDIPVNWADVADVMKAAKYFRHAFVPGVFGLHGDKDIRVLVLPSKTGDDFDGQALLAQDILLGKSGKPLGGLKPEQVAVGAGAVARLWTAQTTFKGQIKICTREEMGGWDLVMYGERNYIRPDISGFYLEFLGTPPTKFGKVSTDFQTLVDTTVIRHPLMKRVCEESFEFAKKKLEDALSRLQAGEAPEDVWKYISLANLPASGFLAGTVRALQADSSCDPERSRIPVKDAFRGRLSVPVSAMALAAKGEDHRSSFGTEEGNGLSRYVIEVSVASARQLFEIPEEVSDEDIVGKTVNGFMTRSPNTLSGNVPVAIRVGSDPSYGKGHFYTAPADRASICARLDGADHDGDDVVVWFGTMAELMDLSHKGKIALGAKVGVDFAKDGIMLSEEKYDACRAFFVNRNADHNGKGSFAAATLRFLEAKMVGSKANLLALKEWAQESPETYRKVMETAMGFDTPRGLQYYLGKLEGEIPDQALAGLKVALGNWGTWAKTDLKAVARLAKAFVVVDQALVSIQEARKSLAQSEDVHPLFVGEIVADAMNSFQGWTGYGANMAMFVTAAARGMLRLPGDLPFEDLFFNGEEPVKVAGYDLTPQLLAQIASAQQLSDIIDAEMSGKKTAEAAQLLELLIGIHNWIAYRLEQKFEMATVSKEHPNGRRPFNPRTGHEWERETTTYTTRDGEKRTKSFYPIRSGVNGRTGAGLTAATDPMKGKFPLRVDSGLDPVRKTAEDIIKHTEQRVLEFLRTAISEGAVEQFGNGLVSILTDEQLKAVRGAGGFSETMGKALSAIGKAVQEVEEAKGALSEASAKVSSAEDAKQLAVFEEVYSSKKKELQCAIIAMRTTYASADPSLQRAWVVARLMQHSRVADPSKVAVAYDGKTFQVEGVGSMTLGVETFDIAGIQVPGPAMRLGEVLREAVASGRRIRPRVTIYAAYTKAGKMVKVGEDGCLTAEVFQDLLRKTFRAEYPEVDLKGMVSWLKSHDITWGTSNMEEASLGCVNYMFYSPGPKGKDILQAERKERWFRQHGDEKIAMLPFGEWNMRVNDRGFLCLDIALEGEEPDPIAKSELLRELKSGYPSYRDGDSIFDALDAEWESGEGEDPFDFFYVEDGDVPPPEEPEGVLSEDLQELLGFSEGDFAEGPDLGPLLGDDIIIEEVKEDPEPEPEPPTPPSGGGQPAPAPKSEAAPVAAPAPVVAPALSKAEAKRLAAEEKKAAAAAKKAEKARLAAEAKAAKAQAAAEAKKAPTATSEPQSTPEVVKPREIAPMAPEVTVEPSVEPMALLPEVVSEETPVKVVVEPPTETPVEAPSEPSKTYRLAVIGTAGRGPEKMSKELYEAMVTRLDGHIQKLLKNGYEVTLVSGGAAWADHTAVTWFGRNMLLEKRDLPVTLELHFPGNLTKEGFAGEGKSPSTANFYHKRFTAAMGLDTLAQLRRACMSPGVSSFVHEGPKYDGFFKRNLEIGKSADGIVAFTFNPGNAPDPESGTFHTWKNSTAKHKVHHDLGQMAVLEFQGEYRWLSNFHPCQMELGGVTLPTTEHLYQVSKLARITEGELRKVAEMTAPEVKAWGRKVQISPDWESRKLRIMKFLQVQKYSRQNPELREKLLLTGDMHIQEGNSWGDKFWGVAFRDGIYQGGENHLGKILMEVRAEIRKEEGVTSPEPEDNKVNLIGLAPLAFLGLGDSMSTTLFLVGMALVLYTAWRRGELKVVLAFLGAMALAIWGSWEMGLFAPLLGVLSCPRLKGLDDNPLSDENLLRWHQEDSQKEVIALRAEESCFFEERIARNSTLGDLFPVTEDEIHPDLTIQESRMESRRVVLTKAADYIAALGFCAFAAFAQGALLLAAIEGLKVPLWVIPILGLVLFIQDLLVRSMDQNRAQANLAMALVGGLAALSGAISAFAMIAHGGFMAEYVAIASSVMFMVWHMFGRETHKRSQELAREQLFRDQVRAGEVIFLQEPVDRLEEEINSLYYRVVELPQVQVNQEEVIEEACVSK